MSEKNGCLSWKECGNGRKEDSCNCEYRQNNGGYYSKLGDDDKVWLWSSSVRSDNSGGAWYVNFNYGDVGYGSKTSSSGVRCVR